MNKEKFKVILQKHELWFKDQEKGELADLRGADLRRVNLVGVNLRWAQLIRANLRKADLRGIDLRQANLRLADLTDANLKGADLRWADLSKAKLIRANLRGTELRLVNLRGTDLRGANLDQSCWPLWCHSFDAKVGDRLVLQLFAHIARLNVDKCSLKVRELVEGLPDLAVDGFCKYQSMVEPIRKTDG